MFIAMTLIFIRMGVTGVFDDATNTYARNVWYSSIFTYLSVAMMPVIGLASPFWLFVLHALGNASLLATHDEVQKRQSNSSPPLPPLLTLC
jgi:hypothetical protein